MCCLTLRLTVFLLAFLTGVVCAPLGVVELYSTKNIKVSAPPPLQQEPLKFHACPKLALKTPLNLPEKAKRKK
jgi:hypothetical protein